MKLLQNTLEKIDLIKGAAHIECGLSQFTYPRISSKELMHSEILAFLLNPNADNSVSDNIIYKRFLNEIGVEDFGADSSKTEVFTERVLNNGRRIDILITNENRAIIIENKLNNAIDQPKQLSDYYEYISGERYDVKKVVYIPNIAYKKPTENVKNLKILTVQDIINIVESCDATICREYVNLLKYMNNSNITYMNALDLQTNLSDNELAKLIDVANVVNSNEWKTAIYNSIKESLELKGVSDLKINNKTSYCELFFENYNFWVEVYIYNREIKIWLVNKTNESHIDVNVRGSVCRFAFDQTSKSYYYYKCDKIFKYEYPNKADFNRLIEDIFEILPQTISNI